MSEFFNDKVIPPVMAFINTPIMQSLKDGLLYSMPLMITGSVFLLLQNFPVQAVQDGLKAIGIYDVLGVAYNNTFSIMAMIGVIGIAYTYTGKKGYQDGLPAGVIALACWLMAQPQTLMFVAEEGADAIPVSGVIIRDWLAGRGMVAALIIGILVGIVYVWFLDRNITIKMPAGVPQGVANAFTALIPAAVIVVCQTLIVFLFAQFGTTILEFIYTAIQTPLSNVTDNLAGVAFYCFGISFFWWFGIHGSIIMESILGAIITANMTDNQIIIDKVKAAGEAVTSSTPGVKIFTKQIIDNFVNITGSGITMGLVVYLFFFAKSEQLKAIGKLGIGPGIFNVNEPVTFGLPIVLNPIIFVPFIIAPMIAGVGTYLLIDMNILPVFGQMSIPWTMPPVFSGFLLGSGYGLGYGVACAIWQAVIIICSFFVYFPFIKAYDKQCYKEEQEAATEA